ncbi:unnamed protein product [Urochloa humidicola]
MAKRQNVLCRTNTIDDIPGEILELTLLRIPSVAGIIRAAATCKLWRRVIGNAGFLRRFRRLHGPEILGHYRYYKGSETLLFVPFPTPIAINNISNRISLDFLQSSYCSTLHPELQDSRLGLLALNRLSFMIIVCNPWTRQYRELHPPMPWIRSHTRFFLGIFLLDADHDEMSTDLLSMSNFRVLCVSLIHHYHDDSSKSVEASLFNARDGRWLKLGTIAVGDIVPGAIFPSPFVLVGRAGGSICWSNTSANAILHLYESTGEFFRFTLPPERAGVNMNQIYYDRSNLRVIGGNTGSVHLVRIAGDDLEVLCYDRSSRACVVERKIRASQVASIHDEARQYRRWYFSERAHEAAAPGCIVLCDNLCDAEYIGMFSVDTRNIDLKRVQKKYRHGGHPFPYELPWTISACL